MFGEMMEEPTITTTKRIKFEEEEDKISLLPDCLLVEILSRLPSTKYAIRTGTLSKRWQHIWTGVSTLIFDIREIKPPYGDPTHFFPFVDKTLTQCRRSKLNKFQLQLCHHYNDKFDSQVNNLIRYAINCNVQELHLSLWIFEDDRFEFKDDSFFINSYFTHLHLGGCIFNPTGPISWNNLTSLSISIGKLDEHLIANILSGSPLLDTLKLTNCYGYRRLDITSKSVKNLVFSGYDTEHDEFDSLFNIIEINAPYILSLTIQGDLYLSKLLLCDVSSLVKANLNYKRYGHGHFETTPKEEGEEMLKRLILNLRHVKELEVGIVSYKVLSRLEAKGFIFPSNLKVPEYVTSHLYSDGDSLELDDYPENDSSDSDSSHNDSSDNDSSSSDSSGIDSVESIDSEELMPDNDSEDDEVNYCLN